MKRNENVKNIDKENEAESKKRNKKAWLGYVLSLLTAILSACGNFFLKITNENKVTVIFIRNSFQFLLVLPIITGKKIDFVVPDVKLMSLVLLRGVLGPSVLLLIGFSMNYLSLGDTMAIFYTYPVFVGFFACICLKEKCGILNIILTITTIGGFVLVAQPSFIFGSLNEVDANVHNDASRMIGVAFCLSAAILAGLTAVIIRKIGTDVHFIQSMLHYGLVGGMICAIILAAYGITFQPCFQSLPTILGCSFSFFFAQICRTIALQVEKAGPVTLIQTSQIIFSFLLQYIFLNEVPNLLCIVGSSLILLSCVALGIKNILKTVKSSK